MEMDRLTGRKPVVLIDDGQDSKEAVRLFELAGVPFTTYHIGKFAESCCGDLPTTRAPAVFAPDGIFRELDGVRQYLSTKHDYEKLSESAYW